MTEIIMEPSPRNMTTKEKEELFMKGLLQTLDKLSKGQEEKRGFKSKFETYAFENKNSEDINRGR